MRRVIVGHRGAGKSELLLRHAIYFPNVLHFDLDSEIEKATGISIASYFQCYGEAAFRCQEKEVMRQLAVTHPCFVVSLGAGFDISSLPAEFEVLFVRRTTDKDGRIFLNRPRLECVISPLEEFLTRYHKRQPTFMNRADKIYDLPEGLDSTDGLEEKILKDSFRINDAYYTLTPRELAFLEKLTGNYKNIELRTDLISVDRIQHTLQHYPHHNWLVSIRGPGFDQLKSAANIDVDFNHYFAGCQIVSSHSDRIDLGIQQLGSITEKLHLKLCPHVHSVSELIMGHSWQQQDPTNRSFLPRSANGRWGWYRQLTKYFQEINFVRGFIENEDQPSLYQWCALPEKKPQAWAALFGENIHFSRSPLLHQVYFNKKKTFFCSVIVSQNEFESHLNFFIELGLKFAAITSPLKQTAYLMAQQKSQQALELKSANTYFINAGNIFCHNTDIFGFTALVKNIRSVDRVAVWGGGGTLKMLERVLPNAHFYSSQTGMLRDNTLTAFSRYDYLIWAAPNSSACHFPGPHFIADNVIDLNYAQNSSGLEFAALRKVRYINGLEMLEVQALKQQEFWSDHECK